MKTFCDYITTEGAKGGPRSGDHSPVAREVETGAEYMAAKDKSPIIVAQNPVDKKWYALGGLGFVSISKPMRDKATAKKFAKSQKTGANLEPPQNRSLQDKLKLRAQFGTIISDDPKRAARMRNIGKKKQRK